MRLVTRNRIRLLLAAGAGTLAMAAAEAPAASAAPTCNSATPAVVSALQSTLPCALNDPGALLPTSPLGGPPPSNPPVPSDRPGGAGKPACESGNATPAAASSRRLQSAVLCLLNDERSRHHMRRLRLNGRLGRAANRHAKDMVRRHYFAHTSPSGVDFVRRIRRAGYLRSAGAWLVGENLAWGSVNRSTPASIMDAWMHSPGHRANILNRRFREIGIGVTFGAPEGAEGPSATYATDFGSRR
jgi:uncharacterized protein YkwD